MTVSELKSNTDASSHSADAWSSVDWNSTLAEVNHLQARIVKAAKAGKWRRVKTLQHLLTRSHSAKLLAVRRVTENRGKNTPGVDEEVWKTPEDKMRGVNSLRQVGYQSQPLRRIYIPKGKGDKMRPLSIPTIQDRAMQSVYLLGLDPVSECFADLNSYGFRKERSAHDAIEQCFTVLSRKSSPDWILEGDIKSCFDKIDHDWLASNIPMEKKILRKWLKTGYMEDILLNPTNEGVPQGGINSAVIANMTLDGLENKILSIRETIKHLGNPKINFIRYADDFIVTASSPEILETAVKPVIQEFLKERGLELSEQKTKITRIEDGFDFLGFNTRKYSGKLIIKPSKEGEKKFLRKLRNVISKNKQATADHVIDLLNPMIRGWADYYHHVCSSETYNRVDSKIYEMLWKWAKHRHPNKPHKWIKAKYFAAVYEVNWVFRGERIEEYGINRLRNMADTKIVRHTKIKASANPYDPEWKIYFDQRDGETMFKSYNGRESLGQVLKAQDMKCLHCDQPLSLQKDWQLRRKIGKYRSLGNTLENLELFHPRCLKSLIAAASASPADVKDA